MVRADVFWWQNSLSLVSESKKHCLTCSSFLCVSRNTAAQTVSGLQVTSDRLSKQGLISDKIKQEGSAGYSAEECWDLLDHPSNPVVRICKKDAPWLSLWAARISRPSYGNESQNLQAAKTKKLVTPFSVTKNILLSEHDNTKSKNV